MVDIATLVVVGSLTVGVWHARSARFGALLLCSSAFGVMTLVGLIVAWRRGRLDPTSPPVFLLLSFFLPSFVAGSVTVAVGWSRPSYLVYLTTLQRSLVLGEIYAAVAFGALWLGFAVVPADRIFAAAARRFPRMSDRRARPGLGEVLTDAWALIGCGLLGTVVSFLRNPAGFQIGAASGGGALLQYATSLTIAGGFLLWLVRGRLAAPDRAVRWSCVLFVLLTLGQASLASSRGFAIVAAVGAALGWWFARSGRATPRRANSRRVVARWVAAVVVLGFGVVFASTYRSEKAAQSAFAANTVPAYDATGTALAAQQYRGLDPAILARIDARPPFGVRIPRTDTTLASPAPTAPVKTPNETDGTVKVQLRLSGRTLTRIRERGVGGNVTYLTDRLVERLDQVASFGLIVDQRVALRPKERALGLAVSVPQAVARALVPRVFWPGKPVVGDSRKLSGLYFRDNANSYALTVMGDLLRQFGPLGIPVGMALLGAALRLLHGLLLRRPWSPPSLALYVLIMMRGVNLEGFFAGIVSDTIRIAFLFVGVLASVRGFRICLGRSAGLLHGRSRARPTS